MTFGSVGSWKPTSQRALVLVWGGALLGCGTTVHDGDDPIDAGVEAMIDGEVPSDGAMEAASDASVEAAGDGRAGVQCVVGTADCDGDVTNGCEVLLAKDPDHCGACGVACPRADNTIAICAGGVCSGATCDVGYGDCDGFVTTGCEAELGWDAEHCGACGQSCGGAACWDGKCGAPIELFVPDAGSNWTSSLVVDNTHLYWTGSGVLAKPKVGGTPVVLATNSYKGLIVGTLDDLMYEGSSFGDIYRVSKSGGGAVKICAGGEDLATDGAHVYRRGNTGVFRCPIDGGSKEQIIDSPLVSSIAVDSGYLYWYSGVGPGIMRQPLSGGAAALVATAQHTGAHLVVGNGFVSWVEDDMASSGQVYLRGAVSMGGPSSTLVSTKQIGATTIDGQYVYYIDGDLKRVPLAGGKARTLAPGAYSGPVAIDATHVYWVQYPDNQIYRVAKP